jgi:disulfide bond formation protein DsbB
LRAVFLRILGFVILIDLFYMSVGRWWLIQAEEHPPPELAISVETDRATLVGMGETLLRTKGGCLVCHKITEQGNERGPDLRGVGARAATRQPGLAAETYLRQSLVEPGAHVVAEFAAADGSSIMPPADKPPADLGPTELKAVVAYLQSLGGEVTVEITPEDVAAAAARRQKPASAGASTHPGATLLTAKGCVACHDVAGTARLVGPPLSNVGERLSAAEIRQSIVDPDAVVAPGFPAGVMLRNFADQLTPEELDQLVAYLSGEVSLGERLSHPGVQLAALILLFNGGVLAALQWASARARATAAFETVPVAPAAKPSWRPLGAALVALALVGGLYAALRERAPAPPAAPPAPPAAPPAAAPPAGAASAAAPPAATAPATLTAEDGRALFMRTCPACHGPDAKGMPGLGKDMTTSEFVRSKSDQELVEFIKKGRAIDDPLNTTGVPMPPMGANPTLTDAELLAIVKFIRSLSG